MVWAASHCDTNSSWPRKAAIRPRKVGRLSSSPVSVAAHHRRPAVFRSGLGASIPRGVARRTVKVYASMIRSQGRRRIKSGGSVFNQRSSVGRSSRLSTVQNPPVIRRAARSRSSMSNAWRTASSNNSWCANQAAATRWSSATCAGSTSASNLRCSSAWNRW